MRTVKGYQLKVQDTFHLSQEANEHLRAKMSVFAVALKSIFDDPILVKGDSITAHYRREDYARETFKHVQDYLQSLNMTDKVTATLVDMQLSLGWDETPVNGKQP